MFNMIAIQPNAHSSTTLLHATILKREIHPAPSFNIKTIRHTS